MNRVVYAFVRFQPPTAGHEQLIETVLKAAREHSCHHAIYVSRTCDADKNPLSVDKKMHYLREFFPLVNFVAASDTTRTPIEAAKELNKTYTDLVFVAGGDRMNLHDLLMKYNKIEYDYGTINYVSAGDRDPDSEGVTGVSGTGLRESAAAGDYDTFKAGLPSSASEHTARTLMAEVKAGLSAKKTPVKKKKTAMEPKENNERQGTYVARKRGMSSPGYPQTFHNTGATGGIAETRTVPLGEHWEREMSKAVNSLLERNSE